MREFSTGATRNTDTDKPDYEGFFSSLVFKRFGEYMHKHRKQADGQLRASDNWQKGIPVDAYMDSMWRHFFDTWHAHRSGKDLEPQQIENLCAMFFNVQGMMHELLKHHLGIVQRFDEQGNSCGYIVESGGKALSELLADLGAAPESTRDAFSNPAGAAPLEPAKWPVRVVLDFDGVIHDNSEPFVRSDVVSGKPLPGAFQAITQYINAGLRVAIYSGRSASLEGRKALKQWFHTHGLPAATIENLEFPDQKPSGELYIDDRGYQFTGSFPHPDYVKNFTPWNK